MYLDNDPNNIYQIPVPVCLNVECALSFNSEITIKFMMFEGLFSTVLVIYPGLGWKKVECPFYYLTCRTHGYT